MNLQQAGYLVGESFRTLGRHKGVMMLSIVIMSLSLLVLAVFLLATDNILTLLAETRRELKVYVYLEDGLTSAQIEEKSAHVLAIDGVETSIFISKGEAMQEFRAELGEEASVLESLESNPLPASFKISLKPDHQNREGAEAVALAAGQIEGVEEVNYGRDFLERFSLLARVFAYIDVVLGVIVLLSSVFIISNTVRLTILSRRSSIEILKLVGATNRFITTPFLIEGAFQGGVASVLSLGLLTVIFILIKKMLPDMAFLPPEKIVVYVLTCILLGSVGSYAALRRFLHL
jgi:cell division transport system permease protein